MPELPDVIAYIECLRPRVGGSRLEKARVISPFILRTFDPPVDALIGKTVQSVARLGKRIVLGFDDELFLVIHLMIAGRFRWLERAAAYRPGKIDQAAFEFSTGRLLLTEASQKKRAAIYIVSGARALAQHAPGGINVLETDLPKFAAALRRENHTVKRSLTDPRVFDGIGNAYSDEILHAARLSPIKLTNKMADGEIARLFAAAQSTLELWIDRLRERFAAKFPGPGEITAFRPEFAVHGKFGQGCPVCGAPVQRICYAENETNYCPGCQTEGKILADRSLSRLLKDDWPRALEELEPN